nr:MULTISPECIES: hypothetical protein [unclassified Ochrobactrum]
MPSKEYEALVEKVAREIAKSRGRDPEECVFGSGSTIHGFTCHQKAWEREVIAAQAAISTIRAALKEPSEHMLAEAMYLDRQIYVWRAMLAASALGEQSE